MWMKESGEALDRLREEKPIVHCITNLVTIRDCANAILAIGASPIMASHPDEVFEVVKRSKALVLNTGTLQPSTGLAVSEAVKAARKENIPVVLDPVGVGISRIRQDLVRFVIEEGLPQVIKGNAGEISAIYRLLCEKNDGRNLCFNGEKVKRMNAIDSALEPEEVREMAVILARRYKCVVAVTGERDIVTDGNIVLNLHNGVLLLPKLTGTGCMTTALVGAFIAVSSPLIAAVAGISCMSIAGEQAFTKIQKETDYGSFSIALHDALGSLASKILYEEGRVENERE